MLPPIPFMKQKPKLVHSLAWLALAWLAALPSSRGQNTATLTTLHTFTGPDGGYPSSGLILGSDGNFYGLTGGVSGDNDGTFFRMTPTGTLTTLYAFNGSTDGGTPGGDLIQGGGGNFYGTATGILSSNDGTVFRITPAGVITTLYSFTGAGDGATPEGGVILGSDGNLYGTTTGGDDNFGTIFRVTPAGAISVLYRFTGGSDGENPEAGLIQGSDGNFYGTTTGGETTAGVVAGYGSVFRITPAGAFTTLYSFDDGTDGGFPTAGLLEGGNGNFYGTTEEGGTAGSGTAFMITPGGALTTLYTFTGVGSDGMYPAAALILGSDGNFYGTTAAGGSAGAGTVFMMTPAGVVTTLYSFNGSSDGTAPFARLRQDGAGIFYGTTNGGESGGYGTVFKLQVGATPAFFDGEVSVGDGVYYLTFPSGNYFGYYSFLADPAYIYHFDLGYEYVFDADDGNSGVYFYDFTSSDFFYTSPVFPFPYLYDFNLNSVVYYYPDPSEPGHYNTNGVRYFYVFNTGGIISK